MNPCESCRQSSCTWFAAIDVSQDWYLAVSPRVWSCCLFCVSDIYASDKEGTHPSAPRYGLSRPELQWAGTRVLNAWAILETITVRVYAESMLLKHMSMCICTSYNMWIHMVVQCCIYKYECEAYFWYAYRTITVCIHTRTSDVVCTRMIMLNDLSDAIYKMIRNTDDDRQWWR